MSDPTQVSLKQQIGRHLHSLAVDDAQRPRIAQAVEAAVHGKWWAVISTASGKNPSWPSRSRSAAWSSPCSNTTA